LLRVGMADATDWTFPGAMERAVHRACDVNIEMSSDAWEDQLLLLALTGPSGNRSRTPDGPRPLKIDGRTGGGTSDRDQRRQEILI